MRDRWCVRPSSLVRESFLAPPLVRESFLAPNSSATVRPRFSAVLVEHYRLVLTDKDLILDVQSDSRRQNDAFQVAPFAN